MWAFWGATELHIDQDRRPHNSGCRALLQWGWCLSEVQRREVRMESRQVGLAPCSLLGWAQLYPLPIPVLEA